MDDAHPATSALESSQPPEDDLCYEEAKDLLGKFRHSVPMRYVLLRGLEALDGNAAAALGPARVEVCKARRADAAQALQYLEGEVLASHYYEEENETKATYAAVKDTLEGFRKALAMLDAYERLAVRACRSLGDNSSLDSPGACRSVGDEPEDPLPAPRGEARDPQESTTATMPPDNACSVSSGSPQQSSATGVENVAAPTCNPPSCAQLAADAIKLGKRMAAALAQDSGGSAQTSWSLWGLVMRSSACCTSRQDSMDHATLLEHCLASFESPIHQAERGDVLCCAPADMSIDAIRYFCAPERGSFKKAEQSEKAVKRGDRVLVEKRRGPWIYSKTGWLPLWSPISAAPTGASMLFVFDHHSDIEDDTSDEDLLGTSDDESLSTAASQDVEGRPRLPTFSSQTRAQKKKNLAPGSRMFVHRCSR